MREIMERLASKKGMSVVDLFLDMSRHPQTAMVEMTSIVQLVQRIGKARGMSGPEKRDLAI